jgi:antitoxin ParD1/3/4
MSNGETVSVALTPEMAAEIRAAVERGEYGSVSEVVRDPLHEWRVQRRRETLELDEPRRLVDEGVESGPGIDADAVFRELRASSLLKNPLLQRGAE